MYSSLKDDLQEIDDFKNLFCSTYVQNGIMTFDGIHVEFLKSQFYHIFKESSSGNSENYKDQWAFTRLKRILWIKKALEDSSADLYKGWMAETKEYSAERRVCRVDTNYIVVIRLISAVKAKIVTAYLVDTERALSLIKNSPAWKMPEKFKKNTADSA